jgi:hypothetical protein
VFAGFRSSGRSGSAVGYFVAPVAPGQRGGQNVGMDEPEDYDDPSLARTLGTSGLDREELMRKARRKFWLCFWITLPIGLVVWYYVFAASR